MPGPAVSDRPVSGPSASDPSASDPSAPGSCGPAPPDLTRPDRYADAVRARRTELREARAQLLGGHRAELRHALAVGRLAASTELAAALAGLDRELRDRADRADRAGRAELPALVAAAVDRLAGRTAERWAAVVLPALRRVAAVRGLPSPVSWPGADGPGDDPVSAVLSRRPDVALPSPDPPPSGIRTLLTGAGGGTWRLAVLPAAAVSAAGLPALGGPSLLPAAVGVGLALLVVAARTRRAAAERSGLRRWSAEVVAALRQTWDTELARRLLEVERLATAALDDAAARRRAEVDAELRALAAGPPGSGR